MFDRISIKSMENPWKRKRPEIGEKQRKQNTFNARKGRVVIWGVEKRVGPIRIAVMC